MKIYPNKSAIEVKKEIDELVDIPLAYIDTTSSAYNIEVNINEKLKTYTKQELLPYSNVDTNICLFDKYENQISYDDMVKNFSKNKDGGYLYIPKINSTNFRPKKFEYKIKAKKKIKYQSNMLYNINALFYNNKEYANKIMPILGDAANRNLAPGNISINNNDVSLNRLCETTITDSDITFFLLKNFETILEENNNELKFDKNYYINEFDTNFFFIVKNDFAIRDYEGEIYDTSKVNLLYSNSYNNYVVSNPRIYNNSNINTKYYFNIPNNTSTVKYHSLFVNKDKTPVLIEEHIGKTFVIYISEDLLNSVITNHEIMYEAFSFIYFNSYCTSQYISDWIADEMPDYIVKDNKLTKKTKFTSDLSISEILEISTNEIASMSVLIDYEKYPYVRYVESYNNHLTFMKIKGDNNIYADPKEKPENLISIYINEEIFFYEDFIYKINNSIEDCVNIQKIDDKIVIELKPFKHSDTGIYIKYEQAPITISLIDVINNVEKKIQNETYYLICKQNDSLGRYELLNKKEYMSNDLILLTINISEDISKTENTIYDMRHRGGGLPLDSKDNFDCFDIGNILGRPYRKAGSLIITLPKYLEEYKEQVMNIVKQYMLAEDYPIVIFKEDK